MDAAVGTCCLYFSSPSPPSPDSNTPGNILFLNGEGKGIVNNMCLPSEVSSTYAPPGKTLISTSTVGTYPDLDDAQLEQRVREHLCSWWGTQEVAKWQLLRIYRIPFAQPNQVWECSVTEATSVRVRGLLFWSWQCVRVLWVCFGCFGCACVLCALGVPSFALFGALPRLG